MRESSNEGLVQNFWSKLNERTNGEAWFYGPCRSFWLLQHKLLQMHISREKGCWLDEARLGVRNASVSSRLVSIYRRERVSMLKEISCVYFVFPPSLLPLSPHESYMWCRANIITRIRIITPALLTYGIYTRTQHIHTCKQRRSIVHLDELDYFLPIDSIRLSTGISAIYNDIYIYLWY